MAEEIYNAELTTTAEDTTSIVTASSLDSVETIIHYTNDTDVAVTIVINGSRAGDSDFSEGVELNSESVASGASGYYTVSEPWDKVELSVTASATPTGSVTAYRMDSN